MAPREQGLAAGLFNTCFQIGGALLVAITSAVVSGHTSATATHAAGIIDSIRPTLLILIPVALAGVVALFVGSRVRPGAPEPDVALVDAY